jgi:DNA mismatch repair ATPase MutL
LSIKASENNTAKKKVTTPKKKTEEVEEQEEQEQEQEEEDEDQKVYREFAEGKDVEDDNEEYEDDEEGDDEDDQLNSSAMEEDALESLEQEAKEANSLPLIRDTKRRYADDKLSPAVLKQLKRLGFKVPDTVTPATYREKTANLSLPAPLAYLSNAKADDKLFKSEKYDLPQMEFVVCDLQEWNDFAFLKQHNDAVIIAEGDVLLVTRTRPGEKVDHSDPQVWIVDEENAEGPIALSKLLATFEEDDSEPAEE